MVTAMKFTIPLMIVLMLSVCQSPGQAQMNREYGYPGKPQIDRQHGYPGQNWQHGYPGNFVDNSVVRFRQSGGFAAVNRTARVQVANLSGRDRQRMVNAINRSGIMQSRQGHHLNPNAADVFVYEISISNRRGPSRTVVFDDTTLPQSYRPLINLLAQHAKNNGPNW